MCDVIRTKVYNEQVFDLLRPSKKILKVRNHKSIGPYVEGLAQLAVNSYSTINELMEQGGQQPVAHMFSLRCNTHMSQCISMVSILRAVHAIFQSMHAQS